jgi:hypothetical protein
MADVLSQRELDDYREQADRFIAAIDEEYYLHYSGLKGTLDLEPIYDEFADLTSLERANALGAAADGDRHVRELWRFASQGYLGILTREHAERLAETEAELTATVDGEEIPYRMLRPRSDSDSSSPGTRLPRSTCSRSSSMRRPSSRTP